MGQARYNSTMAYENACSKPLVLRKTRAKPALGDHEERQSVLAFSPACEVNADVIDF